MQTFDRKTEPQKQSPDAMNETMGNARDNEMSLEEATVSYDIPRDTLSGRVRKQGDVVA